MINAPIFRDAEGTYRVDEKPPKGKHFRIQQIDFHIAVTVGGTDTKGGGEASPS
jgi:hypothetical protein